MDNVELIGLRTQGMFLHENERRIPIHQALVEPKRVRAGGIQAGCGLRISAGKERHLMALPNEFFGQIGHDPLGASIEPRRNAFPQRGDLCDFHVDRPFKLAMRFNQTASCLRETARGMLAQDHNATEAARMHSEKNWKMMLDGLKKFVEK